MTTYIFNFVLLGFLLIGTVEASQERFALVIGNGDYKDAPLRNSVNDARDMAAKLGQQGFTVTQLLNADQRKMENAIKQFSRQLREKSVGLFYFAGHGVEVGGTNYLIPIGADIDNENDAKYEAVDAGRILDGMKSDGNDLNLVILDACRNNPYSRSFRGASRGLSRMMPASGSLILYATEPGQTAEDGDGRNGVFTKYLMDAMNQPGLSVEKAFKQTAREVKRATGGKQKPWMEGMILGEFQFIAASAQRPKPGVSNADLLLWQSMQKCGTESCMKAYLDAYPNGDFASLAKIQQQSSQQTDNGLEALQKADDAFKKSDYARAFGLYQQSAEQGNANTQSILGWMYHNGKGVAKDEKEAAKWYRKAAEQGDASGQFNLGAMYHQGRGVAQDDKEAVKWYRKAADQGDARGQFNLGAMHEQGVGVAQDDKEAVKWYRKAADQGDARGQTYLGWMYHNGKGVVQDDKEAVKWYRKAAEQGSAYGQYYLGRMYDMGKGVQRFPGKAAGLILNALGKDFDFFLIRSILFESQLTLETRKEIQRRLKEAGDYKGAIDGQFGLGTQRALRTWAKK